MHSLFFFFEMRAEGVVVLIFALVVAVANASWLQGYTVSSLSNTANGLSAVLQKVSV